MVRVGDSAHTIHPTSASGTTVALEDAFSLAALLHLSKKDKAPLALRVQNRLRQASLHPSKIDLSNHAVGFERVTCAQKMGFRNRENFHNTDWDAAAKNPDSILKQVDKCVS